MAGSRDEDGSQVLLGLRAFLFPPNQSPELGGTRIFFIGVRTKTYGDFGRWRNPFP
jgi:hypothetical protein